MKPLKWATGLGSAPHHASSIRLRTSLPPQPVQPRQASPVEEQGHPAFRMEAKLLSTREHTLRPTSVSPISSTLSFVLYSLHAPTSPPLHHQSALCIPPCPSLSLCQIKTLPLPLSQIILIIYDSAQSWFKKSAPHPEILRWECCQGILGNKTWLKT